MNKIILTSFAIVSLLFTALLMGLALNIQTIKAGNTIYIRADGSVDPPTASISSIDNVTYVLTDNINEPIVVERNNTIIDGAGYTVQGIGGGRGLSLYGVRNVNVTIKNTNIRNFYYGVYLNSTSHNLIIENNITANSYDGVFVSQSSENTISRNDITNNGNDGVKLGDSSSDNKISENNITGNNDDGIQLYECPNNIISGNNITANNDMGVYTRYSSSSSMIANDITHNRYGIELWASWSNSIIGNNITANDWYGVWLDSSSNNSISGNYITDNYDGVYLYESSSNIVSGNSITTNNDYGVWLDSSSNNSISGNYITANSDAGIYFEHYSQYNTIIINNITSNSYGIHMSASSDNIFHHNNFVDNTVEVYIPFPGDPSFWNGPLEGNYWSDYAGFDLNRDGIGDSARVIDANNRDNFPLMGLFNTFNTSLGYHVDVISNSTIGDFEFFKSSANITIKMHVSNMTSTQTAGLCRVCIPHVLMTEIYNVTIEGAEPHYVNYTLHNNGTHGWIYFNYNHSTLEVIIQGLDNEPPIIDIIAPENKTYSDGDVALSFLLYEPTSWIGYSLDEQANVTISGNTTVIGLSDGVHTITLFANDTADNMGHSNTVNFTVDTLPPNIVILSPENKSYITSSIFLNFTINEATSWIGYSLDDQMNVTVSGNTTLLGLSDGPHTVIVYANDTVGNMGYSAMTYFTVDTVSPNIVILSPENKTYPTSSIALNFIVSEPTSWIGYSLDEQANVTISGNTTLFGLADESHTVILYANDTTGNMGLSNMVYFTVDTILPNIEIISPENKTYAISSVSLNFAINKATSWIGYSLDDQMNVTVSGNTTLLGLSDGPHTVIVYANDTVGNMGLSNMVYFTVDTVPPNIEVMSPENKTYATSSVSLDFTIDKAVSWIGYSLDDQTNVTITGNTTLTDLLDGSHYVIVYANDTLGNMGVSNVAYFTVDITAPNIAVVSQIPPKNNVLPEDEVRVNATVTDDLSGVKGVTLNYTTNNGTWFSVDMTNLEGTIWNATIPAFPYCTNVNYTVVAEDNVGNTITTDEMEYQYHVIPEFPSLLILPLFMIATLIAVVAYRRKRTM